MAILRTKLYIVSFFKVICCNEFYFTSGRQRAMCSRYNGKTLPPGVMLRIDGRAELIRRAETIDDLDATLWFTPKSAQAY